MQMLSNGTHISIMVMEEEGQNTNQTQNWTYKKLVVAFHPVEFELTCTIKG